MNTVVIVENSRKLIDNYIRMLEACKEKIECKYFRYPEKAVEYIRREGAAVLVCELDMPIMSGKEVFDMVEIISPETVKIAMAQVKDVRETLEIVNHSRIFKLILKPFFLSEDLVEPIKSALNYYKLQEKKKNHSMDMTMKWNSVDKDTKKLVDEVEKKKQTYHNICKTMTGIIKGNLQCGSIELSPGEKDKVVDLFEGMFQEFMRYYMFGAQNYIFHINYLMNLFHCPEEHRVFRLRKGNNQEIPNEILEKIVYTIFIIGYASREIYGSYQMKAVIDKENGEYVLGLLIKVSKKTQEEQRGKKRVMETVMQMVQKMIDVFVERRLKETSEGFVAEKIYYKEGELSDE